MPLYKEFIFPALGMDNEEVIQDREVLSNVARVWVWVANIFKGITIYCIFPLLDILSIRIIMTEG